MRAETVVEGPITYLDDTAFSKLELSEKKVKRLLRSSGLPKREVRRRVHRKIRHVTERKSAVSPYEALRATHILRASVSRAGLTEAGGITFTISLLRHRTPLGSLSSYDVKKALRKWREALKRLREMGLNVAGFTVLEIDLCRPLDSAAFYEPHLHGVIWGASVEQLRRAFVIRKLAKGAVRNRPKHFKPLSDLRGYLGYATKFEPWLHFKTRESKRGVWSDSRLPDDDAHEWRLFMSRYRVCELVKFHRIDDGSLGVDGAAELDRSHRHLSSGRPKSGPEGHPRPRG